MDLPQYLQGLSFRFVQPEQKRSVATRAAVATLSAFGLPLDALNTRLPFDRSEMRRRLHGARAGSVSCPLAIQAIVNRGVAQLGDESAFVAFGGDGGSLLAAVAGNRDKPCVGVWDGEPTPASGAFLRRFEAISKRECHFLEESFPQGITRLDDRLIGFCFVGATSYEPVARRLADCEPHLAENAYVLVENGNCDRTRQAVSDFVANSRNQYRLLLEARTIHTCSLTWGRGLLVMQLLGRNAVLRQRSDRSTPPVLLPAA
jgi:hypothetical protein